MEKTMFCLKCVRMKPWVLEDWKKALPEITNVMQTNTLRELEADGLVNRKQFNEIPPHVEYSLTEKGRDLMPIFYEIFIWGMKYNAVENS